MKQNNQFLINKIENTGLKHLNDSKTFIEYSNDMDDIYKNIIMKQTNKQTNKDFKLHLIIHPQSTPNIL